MVADMDANFARFSPSPMQAHNSRAVNYCLPQAICSVHFLSFNQPINLISQPKLYCMLHCQIQLLCFMIHSHGCAGGVSKVFGLQLYMSPRHKSC